MKSGKVWKVTAAAGAVAVIVYQLLRRVDMGVVTKVTDVVTDKIANVFLPNSTASRIYEAAYQRLQRKFSLAHCKTLALLMVAQSKHETANYTSRVFKLNNNAFGYKDTTVSIWDADRAGTMSPEGNAYEYYNDVADSAREVADWLGRRKADFDESKISGSDADKIAKYAAALKKNDYYGNPLAEYVSGMKNFYQA